MSNKTLDANALNAIMNDSEVKENRITDNVDSEISARRVRKRVQYRNFSISLELSDYNKFQQYLIDNEIRSGSALIRELLKDSGIL